jgi:hypothetical protein
VENDKKLIYQAFLKTTFTPIIQKIIAFNVIVLLGKMKAHTNIKSKRAFTSEQREAIFHEYMQGDAAKGHILGNLKGLEMQKVDVLAHMLKEYSMDKGELATYDHDFLTKIFDAEMVPIRKAVSEGRYQMIYYIASRKDHAE